jgi:hypothetical protein
MTSDEATTWPPQWAAIAERDWPVCGVCWRAYYVSGFEPGPEPQYGICERCRP